MRDWNIIGGNMYKILGVRHLEMFGPVGLFSPVSDVMGLRTVVEPGESIGRVLCMDSFY